MTKRTINFGDDVCSYIDIAHNSNIQYVKPCEEGKQCKDLLDNGEDYSYPSTQDPFSGYHIYTCQPYEEDYDNLDQTCEASISCTSGYYCDGTCKAARTCPAGQVFDSPSTTSTTCVNEPNYCEEYAYPHSLTKSYGSAVNKECVEIELKADSNNKNYNYVKVKYNTIASIEDGKYIKDSSDILYCKNGYALYFYGNGKVKNPNDDYPSSEQMFLRCVHVLGRDESGIIKYEISGEGNVMYYNPDQLPTNPNTYSRYVLPYNDKYLMTRLEIFDNYKKRLEAVTDCKELNCEDDELNKWYYFLGNPQEYILYKNEPQVMEYLIQQSYPKYKAKYTSPYESSSLLNIKYLSLLSLLLLF